MIHWAWLLLVPVAFYAGLFVSALTRGAKQADEAILTEVRMAGHMLVGKDAEGRVWISHLMTAGKQQW